MPSTARCHISMWVLIGGLAESPRSRRGVVAESSRSRRTEAYFCVAEWRSRDSAVEFRQVNVAFRCGFERGTRGVVAQKPCDDSATTPQARLSKTIRNATHSSRRLDPQTLLQAPARAVPLAVGQRYPNAEALVPSMHARVQEVLRCDDRILSLPRTPHRKSPQVKWDFKKWTFLMSGAER